MPRLFAFRGKSAEELRNMGIEEYAKLIGSRERRAIRRMGADYKQLIEKVEDARKNGKDAKVIRTHVREAPILPGWMGMKFAVHNGKEFKELTITEEMLGHRLGEFSFTTKRVLHSAPGIRATRGSKFLAVK
jgi:small subunit ribosomal protein S19